MGKLDCYGATHQGFRKEFNEDQFVIADVRKTLEIFQTSLALDDRSRVNGNSLGKLLAVADGTGRPESASRASVLAIDRLIDFAVNQFNWNSTSDNNSNDQLCRELAAAFWWCQESIVQEATVLSETFDRDMASSLTLAVVNWPSLYLASVGNCRCYRLRAEKLEQLTADQTTPAKAISPDEKKGTETIDDSGNEVIVNIVGGVQPELKPQVATFELAFGDSILLCSDGLTQHLADSRILQILASPITAADCCESLINETLVAGGHDNVTVVVGRFLLDEVNPQRATAEVDVRASARTEGDLGKGTVPREKIGSLEASPTTRLPGS